MKLATFIFLALAALLPARTLDINLHKSGRDTVTSGETAGLVPVAGEFWNNVGFAAGGGAARADVQLTDDAGTANAARFESTLASAYVGSSGATGAGGDRDMMASYVSFNDGDNGLMRVSNLGGAFATPGYRVYIYFDTDATNRTHTITVTPAGGSAISIRGDDSGTFSGAYVEASGAGTYANVAVFTGLSAASFEITMDSDIGRGAVNGIQIVSNDHPVPPCISSFAASDSEIALGSSTTLSWQTSGATTLSIDNGVGDVTGITTGGAGSISVSPSATTTYTLSAANGQGTTTTTASVTVREATADSHPNIILFLVDDMGWQDTSVPLRDPAPVWNSLYKTPNMERLAARGMKFTNAYAASPVCSPTRDDIMTGWNPAHNHVSDWTRKTPSLGNANRYVESPPWRTAGLQPGQGFVTLPSVLHAAGYRTIHVGKAHFGCSSSNGGNNPLNLGFDVNHGGSEIGGPKPGYSAPWSTSLYPNLKKPDDTFPDDYLTKTLTYWALKSIDDAVADGVPFYINMAHYAVHAPIAGQGDPEFTNDPDYAGRPSVEIDYAAMLQSMDQSLGVILDHLDAIGVADNTIVIFMSDNGGLSNHTRATSPSPWIRDWHNSPLRSGKGSAYEGGYRVPMIVAWADQAPGQAPSHPTLPIPPASANDEPVHIDDFYPTILSLAGVDPPQPYAETLDGQDITPLFEGEPFQRNNVLLWHYPHQWYHDIGIGLGIEPFTSIRDGDWKILYFYRDGYADGQLPAGTDPPPDGKGSDPFWELYNLAEDIGEANNLAAAEPARLARMARKLVRRMHEMGGQFPVSKATNQQAPPFIPLAAGLDADGDGLEDTAEDPNNNGLVDPGETDPDNADTDGDRHSDGEENAAGTDPFDPRDFFSAAIPEFDGAEVTLSWRSEPGLTYLIQASNTLAPESWTTIGAGIPAASSGKITTHTLSVGGAARKFYRVGVE